MPKNDLFTMIIDGGKIWNPFLQSANYCPPKKIFRVRQQRYFSPPALPGMAYVILCLFPSTPVSEALVFVC